MLVSMGFLFKGIGCLELKTNKQFYDSIYLSFDKSFLQDKMAIKELEGCD